MTLIIAVAVGVGVFLVVACCELFRIKLSYLLIGVYALVFLLAQFVPRNFFRWPLIPAASLPAP